MSPAAAAKTQDTQTQPTQHDPYNEVGETDRVVVLLGNPAPQHQVPVRNEETGEQTGWRSIPHPFLNQAVTRVEVNPEVHDKNVVENTLSTDNDRMLSLIAKSLKANSSGDEYWAIVVSELEQILGIHSAGTRPSWVRSNNEELQRVLADYFECPQGEPLALVTNGGRDAFHAQMFSTSAQPASFNYMAITTDATAAAATDTTLASEETTNGLGRAQATYAHTGGTNTTTLTKTFTYTGSTSKVLAKIGIFNAASVGTMGIETLLNSTATVTTSGDNVTVTETITA